MQTGFRFSRGLAVLYIILLILAVPWYWPAEEARLLWGMPIWVISTIVIGALTAGLTAWVLLRSSWVDDDDGESQ